MNEQSGFDFLTPAVPEPNPSRDAINALYHADEAERVLALLYEAELDAAASARVRRSAESLVERVRARKKEQGVLEAFMLEYDLSSEEGVVLMLLCHSGEELPVPIRRG